MKNETKREPRGPRARRKQWIVREQIAMPRASFEELEIRGSDGSILRALVDDPPEDVATEIRATLVLAHAMFARKSSFGKRDRPGLSSALTKRGYRTIAFDFRGHGDSKPPPTSHDWGYDDLVRLDLPAVVECARARSEGKPVLVVGHSLGGHVATAAQGTGRMDADAIVLLGGNVWLRELEPSRLRWAAKLAFSRATLRISSRLTHGIPARRLRFGSDDASERYVEDIFGFATHGEWKSRDRHDDYLASLANVKIPVAAVVGDRDRIMCHPRSGEAFARRCAGPVAIFHARHAGHMALVTSELAHPTVIDAIEWAMARLPGSAR